MSDVEIGGVTVGNARPFVLISGPCQIEGEAHAFECAEALTAMARAAGVPLIYKSSYDKANRTSAGAAAAWASNAASPSWRRCANGLAAPC